MEKMLRLRLLLLAILLTASAAWAQRQMSVALLESFIRSSIEQKHRDKEVADVLKNVRMTERLDARTIENLQGLGAGPRTLEALRALATASARLATPPPPSAAKAAPPPPPAPSEADSRKILAEVTRNALDYTKNLPNFTCTQVTRRRMDISGRDDWRLLDTIQEHLSFVDGMEDYKVVLVNNLPVTNIGHEQLGGTTTRGEFGSHLQDLFKPETKAEFVWTRWATLRGRRMHVFSYRVKQAYSTFSLSDEASGRRMIGGYHGDVFADAETKMVMRLDLDVDGLQDFPVQRVQLRLDYDTVDISGKPYVLPLRAEINSRQLRTASRNEVEFRRYNRFSADAVITFDEPDEIPQDQLEEQPLQ